MLEMLPRSDDTLSMNNETKQAMYSVKIRMAALAIRLKGKQS